jgi:N-acetylglucosamine kinase-like BadF-type ATPase
LETALACLDESEAYDVKLVIISGTGSCCYVTNGRVSAKIGGYGHVIGTL